MAKLTDDKWMPNTNATWQCLFLEVLLHPGDKFGGYFGTPKTHRVEGGAHKGHKEM